MRRFGYDYVGTVCNHNKLKKGLTRVWSFPALDISAVSCNENPEDLPVCEGYRRSDGG